MDLRAACPSNCKLSRLFSVCWACASMGRPWGAQSAIKEAANDASILTKSIQWRTRDIGSSAMGSLFLLKDGVIPFRSWLIACCIDSLFASVDTNYWSDGFVMVSQWCVGHELKIMMSNCNEKFHLHWSIQLALTGSIFPRFPVIAPHRDG